MDKKFQKMLKRIKTYCLSQAEMQWGCRDGNCKMRKQCDEIEGILNYIHWNTNHCFNNNLPCEWTEETMEKIWEVCNGDL